MNRFRTWLVRRRIARLRRNLPATWLAAAALSAEAERMQERVRELEDSLVSDWSPLVEYTPGQRVRFPDGKIYTVAAWPAWLPGVVPRSRREAFGHDAPLDLPGPLERQLRRWLAFGPGVIVLVSVIVMLYLKWGAP